MTKLEFAAFYAAINLLILLVLAFRVSMARGKEKIVLGDGGSDTMLRAIRAHGNASEFIPAGIVGLLFLALLDPAPMALLHAAGLTLTIGRALHAWGLSRNSGISLGRAAGTLLTTLSFLLIIGGLAWSALAPVL